MLSKIVLSGVLSFIGLGEVLQLVGSNGSSGELRLISERSPEPGRIYFLKGNIINAQCGDLRGIDAAYALFGWADAGYEFRQGNPDVPQIITTSRMEIILDGLRMVDDGITRGLGEEEVSEDKSEGRIPVLKGSVVDYTYIVDEEEYYRGRKIVQQDKYGSWMWVVLEGLVDIIKETPEGPLKVIKLGSGAFIGGIASFMYKGNIRKATVQAFSDTQLGVIDSTRMAEEFGQQNPAFRDFIRSLDKRRDMATDMAVDARFGLIRPKKLMGSKKRLIKQGSSDDRLLRLVSGSGLVMQKNKNGYLPLLTLKEGDFIGPVPFQDIGQEPRNASVYLTPDAEVATINPDHIMEGFDQVSLTMRHLIEGIANAISMTTRVAQDYQIEHLKELNPSSPLPEPSAEKK